MEPENIFTIKTSMIYVGDNDIAGIYLGDSEIPAIYCGEELIYPVNLGTLTGITLEDLVWVTDIPASGGTATKDNCSYKVVAYYDSGKSRTVTKDATVTGSLEVSATTAETREMVGTLELTATFEGFTSSGSVEAYQVSVSPIPSTYQELQYIYEPANNYAYIITDIYMNSDMWFEFKVRATLNPGTPEKHIFSGDVFQVARVLANNRMRVRRGGSASVYPTATVYPSWGTGDVEFTLFKNNNNVVANGTTVATIAPEEPYVDTQPGYFFSWRELDPGTTGNNLAMVGYLYYMIIGSNTTGKELYHFVPVKRLSDNEVGLFDIVNRRFYGPANNKKFTAGPVVQ